MSVNSKFVLEVFRSEYSRRLNEVIEEVNVFDDDGNMISLIMLSPMALETKSNVLQASPNILPAVRLVPTSQFSKEPVLPILPIYLDNVREIVRS